MSSTSSSPLDRLVKALDVSRQSQEKFAHTIGISPEWLSKLLNKRATVSPDIALRVDDYLRRAGIERTSPLSDEATSSTLAQEQAPYLTTSPEVSALTGRIRAKFDSLLSAAGDNRDRLGWLVVQLDQMHLYASAWLSNEEVNRRAVERAKKMTAEIREQRRLVDAEDARRGRQSA